MISVPPFLAPAISGAGPLASGRKAAAALAVSPPEVWPPPALLADGLPQAATPIVATAAAATTLVQRIAFLLCLDRVRSRGVCGGGHASRGPAGGTALLAGPSWLASPWVVNVQVRGGLCGRLVYYPSHRLGA